MPEKDKENKNNDYESFMLLVASDISKELRKPENQEFMAQLRKDLHES